jgi:hypothetical protein
MDKIEDRIDEYLSNDSIDEGILSDTGTAGMYVLKKLGRGVEISFDEISRHIANVMEKSASKTSLNKISKMRYRDDEGKLKPNAKKQLKALDKKLKYHKEEFVKILMRIEELTS